MSRAKLSNFSDKLQLYKLPTSESHKSLITLIILIVIQIFAQVSTATSEQRQQEYRPQQHQFADTRWQQPKQKQISGKSNDKLKADDVFISVKTTGKYHSTRVQLILDTWFQLAPKQTYFFTDTHDAKYAHATNGHLIETPCLASHSRRGLACKMAHELDRFWREPNEPRWFCHFDDDNYVNVPRLYAILDRFDDGRDYYLGKPSIRAPLELELHRASPWPLAPIEYTIKQQQQQQQQQQNSWSPTTQTLASTKLKHVANQPPSKQKQKQTKTQRIKFWFATGGAGFCLSRSMARKMMPFVGAGQFTAISERIRLPDDVTVGYIVEHELGQRLTIIDEFHSHLEPMQFLRKDTLSQQVSSLFLLFFIFFLSQTKTLALQSVAFAHNKDLDCLLDSLF
ncbi:Fringe glycosyltransferase, partial [Fragariocoptes setiger]